jgi:hypothetical protein
MKRITTAITHRVATAAIRGSWAILGAAAESLQALGERMEGRAHHLAVRWGCVDGVMDTLTSEALGS